MALIRYPGSKDTQVPIIMPMLKSWRNIAEPFCGTAAISYALIRSHPLDAVWINDVDFEMYALHYCIMHRLNELCALVAEYEPNPADFYRIKSEDVIRDELSAAFNKVILHQISYSGLGRSAGSPIGGRSQDGKYKVGCRWSASTLIKKFTAAHQLLSSVPYLRITNIDVTDADWSDWNLYLDPPYVKAGPGLYQHGITNDVKTIIRQNNQHWVLSHDVDGANMLPVGYISKVVDVRSHLHHKTVKDVIVTNRDVGV